MFRVFSTILLLIAPMVWAQEAARPMAQALKLAKNKDWATAESLAAKEGQIGSDILMWTKLRDKAGSASEALKFLKRNPDWPGLPYLRKQSEGAFVDASRDQVLEFFANDQPQTADGALAYARALVSSGNAKKASLIIQNAWISLPMSAQTQTIYWTEFAPAVKGMREPRLMKMLWDDQHGQVEQMFPIMSDGYIALARARIGLRKQLSDGISALLSAVPEKLKSHPVLTHARFEYRLRAGQRDGAIELLKQASKSDVTLGNPQAWAASREKIVRDMVYDGNASAAYDIARSHNLKDGEDFATLEWLSGYIALKYRNKPDAATKHFEQFIAAVETPISLGRGYYWLGRAYEAMGKKDSAKSAYRSGMEHQTSYYGILCAEKLGLPFDPAFSDWSELPDWRQASFVDSSVFQAAILFFAADDLDLAERFITHLAEKFDDTEILQMTDFLEEAQRPHVLVMLGKRAASMGRNFPRPYYALHPMIKQKSRVPPELSLSIARRESEFNPAVISPVGARGLMQVMPKTGAEVAGRLGLAFSESKLSNDWKFNAQIGNAYLAELGERFGGNPVLMSLAYNAGPTRAERWMEKLGDPRRKGVDIIDWVEMIPFEETRNYVMRVTESLPIYRARLGLEPLPKPFSTMLQGGSLAPLSP